MIPIPFSLSEIAMVFTALYGAFCLVGYVQREVYGTLPPGPKGLPILGNALQMPRMFSWVTFHQWSQQYGPILHLRIFGGHFIVLNSARAISDLLEKRSSIYSDRPQPYMHTEIVGRKHAVFNISSEHARFRKYRRMLREELDSKASKNYGVVMQEQILIMLRGLKVRPASFAKLIRINAVSIILKLAYGYNVESDEDIFLSTIEEAAQILSQSLQPGRWLVDYIPILRFIPPWLPFPGGNFKAVGKQFRNALTSLDDMPHLWVKEQLAKNDYIPSFSSRYLVPEDSHFVSEADDNTIKIVASALYGGGGDTTVSALLTFFLAMALYPSVQARAQQEVDEIIGRNRLPTTEDFEGGELKYVHALIQEVLRWGVVAPLGLPHRVAREDAYIGYRIPKHATVIANIWAVMHDEKHFQNPDEFKPDRHLVLKRLDKGNQGAIRGNFIDPLDYVFGFGRRVCPGLYFAQLSLFLSITSILQTFNIRKAIGMDGKEIEPAIEYSSGITSHPKPFECEIEVRPDAGILLAEN